MLLLDEPLSALDLKLRQHMRNELRAIQQRVGITFIYITHDQGEALTMSDRIAVMNDGVIEQVGDGKTIYDQPATAFVASFVGENNPFPGSGRCKPTTAGAVVETAFGRLARPQSGEARRPATRPSCSCGRNRCGSAQGAADTHASQPAVHECRLRGQCQPHLPQGCRRSKDITLTVGRHDGAAIPEQGATAADLLTIRGMRLVLPEGKLARE